MHSDSEDIKWLEVLPGEMAGINPSRAQICLWSLVLESQGLISIIEYRNKWTLLVPENNYEEACHELDLFMDENRNWPPKLPVHQRFLPDILIILSVIISIALFYNITRLEISIGGYIDWERIGNADAGKIISGEWWRVITALFLHADVSHLAGNLCIGGFFIYFLCYEIGTGVAFGLTLFSGALGNFLNATVQPSTHQSIGASTAIFGAIGILATLNFIVASKYYKRRWFPVAAALALLALLGTEGKNTDLGAHLFGFMSGALLGLIAGYFIKRYGYPGRLVNTLSGIVSLFIVIAAWVLAINT